MTHARSLRLILVTLVALGPSLLSEPLALAAAPGNDDFDSATTISALPYTDTVDITDATSASDDPFGARTVWYRFTAQDQIGIDAVAEPELTTVAVCAFTGTRGSLSVVYCGGSADGIPVRFNTTANQTYFFMLFDVGEDGGLVRFSVNEIPLLPPPLQIGVSIAPKGTVDTKTGRVRVHGGVTCSPDPDLSFVHEALVFVSQTHGAQTVEGLIDSGVSCQAGRGTWSAKVTPFSGKFVPGSVEVQVGVRFFDAAYERFQGAQAQGTVKVSP